MTVMRKTPRSRSEGDRGEIMLAQGGFVRWSGSQHGSWASWWVSVTPGMCDNSSSSTVVYLRTTRLASLSRAVEDSSARCWVLRAWANRDGQECHRAVPTGHPDSHRVVPATPPRVALA